MELKETRHVPGFAVTLNQYSMGLLEWPSSHRGENDGNRQRARADLARQVLAPRRASVSRVTRFRRIRRRDGEKPRRSCGCEHGERAPSSFGPQGSDELVRSSVHPTSPPGVYCGRRRGFVACAARSTATSLLLAALSCHNSSRPSLLRCSRKTASARWRAAC